jgi:chemotaxis protein MotB
MKTRLPLLLLAAVAVASTALDGCVSKGKYDHAVATTRVTQAELERREGQLVQSQTDLRAENAARAAEVERLHDRIAQARAAQRVAEQRAAAYRMLTEKLQKQIDAGDLAVTTRDGRILLELPDDVLFDPGKTELKALGKLTLMAVADTIRSMPGRRFQVAGHTDDVPIHDDRFASNWELSTARALRVVHFLIEEGAPASALSAAGYSDMDPIASNATPEGRKANRRTEIALQPNIDELIKVPR